MLQVVWELWWNGNPFALHGALASAQQRLAQPVAVPAATKGRQQEMDHLKKLGFLGSKYPITLYNASLPIAVRRRISLLQGLLRRIA